MPNVGPLPETSQLAIKAAAQLSIEVVAVTAMTDNITNTLTHTHTRIHAVHAHKHTRSHTCWVGCLGEWRVRCRLFVVCSSINHVNYVIANNLPALTHTHTRTQTDTRKHTCTCVCGPGALAAQFQFQFSAPSVMHHLFACCRRRVAQQYLRLLWISNQRLNALAQHNVPLPLRGRAATRA